MAGKRIIVRYEDGTTATFNPNKPRLLLDLEKQFDVQAPEKHEHLSWVAHRAVGGETPFDEWLDTVEEFDSEGDDDDAENAPGKDQS